MRPALPTMSVIRAAGPLVPLMRKCWDHSPRKRPSFESIVQQLSPRLARQQSSGKLKLNRALEEMSAMKESLSEIKEQVEMGNELIVGVDRRVQVSTNVVLAKLEAAEQRLATEVRAGTAEVLQEGDLVNWRSPHTHLQHRPGSRVGQTWSHAGRTVHDDSARRLAPLPTVPAPPARHHVDASRRRAFRHAGPSKGTSRSSYAPARARAGGGWGGADRTSAAQLQNLHTHTLHTHILKV